jgi:hypothetical protein
MTVVQGQSELHSEILSQKIKIKIFLAERQYQKEPAMTKSGGRATDSGQYWHLEFSVKT